MEIIDTRRTAQEEGRHRWRSLFCEEAVFCAGQALDKGGRLQLLTHHRHPPKTCAWEGCPGVASLFQAHSCLGTLGTRVPPGDDRRGGRGGSSALCSHLPTRKTALPPEAGRETWQKEEMESL